MATSRSPRPWVDRNWYEPKLHDDHGRISIRLGEHTIRPGHYHIRWPDMDPRDLKLFEQVTVTTLPVEREIILQGKAKVIINDIPHLIVTHHGSQMTVALNLVRDIQMRQT